MINSRDYWRVMNGGYLHNPHFFFFFSSVVRGKNRDSGIQGLKKKKPNLLIPQFVNLFTSCF